MTDASTKRADSTIVIACAANACYALPLAVMLNSLVRHLAAGILVEAYVLDDGINPSDRKRIKDSVPGGITINWVAADELPGWLPSWGRMPQTTYQKLLLGRWLPVSVERVLWLDCDLLIQGDISALWESDMSDQVIMAVVDQRVPTVSSRFGVAGFRDFELRPDTQYFNAGVMLINLARWRSNAVGQQAIEYLRTYRNRVYFWDQEALNAVLAGNCGWLESKWNWHPRLDRLMKARINRKTSNEPNRPGAGILHFSGNLKPWLFPSRNKSWRLYNRYVDQTAWSGERPKSGLRSSLLSWYESSSLRPWVYPLESWVTFILHAVPKVLGRSSNY